MQINISYIPSVLNEIDNEHYTMDTVISNEFQISFPSMYACIN